MSFFLNNINYFASIIATNYAIISEQQSTLTRLYVTLRALLPVAASTVMIVINMPFLLLEGVYYFVLDGINFFRGTTNQTNEQPHLFEEYLDQDHRLEERPRANNNLHRSDTTSDNNSSNKQASAPPLEQQNQDSTAALSEQNSLSAATQAPPVVVAVNVQAIHTTTIDSVPFVGAGHSEPAVIAAPILQTTIVQEEQEHSLRQASTTRLSSAPRTQSSENVRGGQNRSTHTSRSMMNQEGPRWTPWGMPVDTSHTSRLIIEQEGPQWTPWGMPVDTSRRSQEFERASSNNIFSANNSNSQNPLFPSASTNSAFSKPLTLLEQNRARHANGSLEQGRNGLSGQELLDKQERDRQLRQKMRKKQ